MEIDPSNLFLINGKWGEIREKFDDLQIVEDIDVAVRKDLMFLEIPTSSVEDEKIIEISFSKLTLKNGQNNYTIIQRAIPRLYTFNTKSTILEVKK